MSCLETLIKTPEEALSSDRWRGLSFHRSTTRDVPVEEETQMKSGIKNISYLGLYVHERIYTHASTYMPTCTHTNTRVCIHTST